MLAIWLGTFSSGAGYILLLWWSGQEWERELPDSQNIPVLITLPLLPVWLTHLTFCLANQRFIKIHD